MKTGLLILLGWAISTAITVQDRAIPGGGLHVHFISKPSENKVDVMAGDMLFTSYTWPGNVYKPILYPVYTSGGSEVTRGFPLRPREGERNDHIHQAGIWLTYGNVSGVDYWGTGHTGSKEPANGEIRHLAVKSLKDGTGEGVLVTLASWINPDGKETLAEETEYHFIAKGNKRLIDRITTLTAVSGNVTFPDTKEGMFGFRVARQLELPSEEMVILLDASGNPSKTKVPAKSGATGNYRSSEGIRGDAVWGTRAKWMALDGHIGNEEVSVVICDHPKNRFYPTYWHARGYGLFAANPLGWSDFTKGREVLGFSLKSGESVTFRYRVLIVSGPSPSTEAIEELFTEFSNRY